MTNGGFPARIILTEMGHRCGYVKVPLNSVLANKEYYQYSDGEEELDAVQYRINQISVHGGLTYCSGDNKIFDEDGWVFGFDAAHAGDLPDINAVIKSGIDRRYIRNNLGFGLTLGESGEIRTLDYMIDECEDLSRQLKIIEK